MGTKYSCDTENCQCTRDNQESVFDERASSGALTEGDQVVPDRKTGGVKKLEKICFDAAAPPTPQDISSRKELPTGWSWPDWCVQKGATIEVRVFDEDLGKDVWMAATIVERIVDPNGQDSYLCAQYVWSGESYQEDFGPDKVRKVGTEYTVFDQLKVIKV